MSLGFKGSEKFNTWGTTVCAGAGSSAPLNFLVDSLCYVLVSFVHDPCSILKVWAEGAGVLTVVMACSWSCKNITSPNEVV